MLKGSVQIEIMYSKIHRLVITEANLNYIGSLTVDQDLIEAAGMYEHQKITVVNCNNGNRLETYLISGERGSGVCCLNGPAARMGMKDDVVIVIAYAMIEVKDAKEWTPVIVMPKNNKLVAI